MFETVRKILIDWLLVPANLVEADATVKHAGLDSLDLAELALALEKEVGIAISEHDLSIADTMGAMADLVEARLASHVAMPLS